jgi:hypothetical protein
MHLGLGIAQVVEGSACMHKVGPNVQYHRQAKNLMCLPLFFKTPNALCTQYP